MGLCLSKKTLPAGKYALAGEEESNKTETNSYAFEPKTECNPKSSSSDKDDSDWHPTIDTDVFNTGGSK
jgi:hypothetical protein